MTHAALKDLLKKWQDTEAADREVIHNGGLDPEEHNWHMASAATFKLCADQLSAALSAMEGEAGKWYCPVCDLVLLPRAVTFEETHDERVGGCGNRVTPIITPSTPQQAACPRCTSPSDDGCWHTCATQPQQAGGDAETFFYRTECALYRGKIDLLMAEVSQADEDGRAFIHKDTITAIITHADTPPQPEAGGGVTEAMVERAAESLYIGACGPNGTATPWAKLSPEQKWLFKVDARAALTAALSTTPASGGEHGQSAVSVGSGAVRLLTVEEISIAHAAKQPMEFVTVRTADLRVTLAALRDDRGTGNG